MPTETLEQPLAARSWDVPVSDLTADPEPAVDTVTPPNPTPPVDAPASVDERPAAPTWQPLSLLHIPRHHDMPVAVTFSGGVASIFLAFSARTLTLAAADQSRAAIERQAKQDAGELIDVRHWLAAEGELAQRQQAADLARARLTRASSERQLLRSEGTGGNLAQRLRDLDREIDTLRTEATEADELLATARDICQERRATATDAVRSACQSATGNYLAATREREAELLRQLVERAGDVLTDLAVVLASRDSAGGRLVTHFDNTRGIMDTLRAAAHLPLT